MSRWLVISVQGKVLCLYVSITSVCPEMRYSSSTSYVNQWKDLFRYAYFDQQVRTRGLQTLVGSQRNVYLGFQPLCEEDYDGAFIELPVLESPEESQMCELILYSYFMSQTHLAPCYPGTVVWDSFPSLDRLRQSHKVSIANLLTPMSPFADLRRAVGIFARRYCSIAAEMPLVGFLAYL